MLLRYILIACVIIASCNARKIPIGYRYHSARDTKPQSISREDRKLSHFILDQVDIMIERAITKMGERMHAGFLKVMAMHETHSSEMFKMHKLNHQELREVVAQCKFCTENENMIHLKHANSKHCDHEVADHEHADHEHADHEHADHEHADQEHADHEHANHEHADHEQADHEHADHEHADHEHADHEHADHEHADHEHADHEHADHEHADHEHADHEHADLEYADHEDAGSKDEDEDEDKE